MVYSSLEAPDHRRLYLYIIIYNYFLPPPRRCCHVKSDNTLTIIQYSPLNPYTLHPLLHFQYLLRFYSLSQPHHLTASHPSPGDNHRSTEERSEHRAQQNGSVKLKGKKVKSSIARSFPVENLLPQNVGSIINYLQ